MDIQFEIQKIHSQFGTTEMANYQIQKLFDKLILEDRAEQLRKQCVSSPVPTVSEIEQQCANTAVIYGYNIAGGGKVVDFTDGFMKGALWMKRVVENGGNDITDKAFGF